MMGHHLKKRLAYLLALALVSLFVIYSSKSNIYEHIENVQMFFYDYESSNERIDNYYQPARILCLILTKRGNLKTKARAVNRTWAQQCHKHYFIMKLDQNETISNHESLLPILSPDNLLVDTYDQLTTKMFLTLVHLLKHEPADSFDWLLKADDDTFVFMSNLHAFVANKNPSRPSYFGHKFQFFFSSYNSGGAGYLLSREAFRRLASHLDEADKESGQPCTNTGVEDWDVGACLRRLSIFPSDAVDEHNLKLFQYKRVDRLVDERTNKVNTHHFIFYYVIYFI